MAKQRLTLALQGGGSHGAFTWGVLDRLLEDDSLEIEAISGASAGAINAVVLAHGYAVGGREGGRQALDAFWQRIGEQTTLGALPPNWAKPIGAASDAAPAIIALMFLTRFFSPHQLNPLDLNPLRSTLEAQVDFERLRADGGIKLFVAATQVSTGRPKLFSNEDITLNTLLASACIPTLNHPVEIDGEAYWDGGLTANPPLQPLLYQCKARDLLVILLDPCRRPEIPATADEITRRLTEISFSSALFAELQGIALAKKEAEGALFTLGRLDRKARRLNLHLIAPEEFANGLSLSSRLNTRSDFINALRVEGRRRATAWLRQNRRLVGARSSFELSAHLC
jgi:NTE family protein